MKHFTALLGMGFFAVFAAANSLPVSFTDPAAAPAWAIPYGEEFWQRNRGLKEGDTSGGNAIDINGTVQRVRHAFRSEPGDAHATARSDSYDVVAGDRMLFFRPHQPASRPGDLQAVSGPPTEVGLRTVRVEYGAMRLCHDEPSARITVGNVVQTRLSEQWGVVEHAEAMPDALYLTWCFDRHPAGGGDLKIDFEIDGLTHTGQSASGHHYADDSGLARMCVGPAELVDATGRRWDVAVSGASDLLSITVPHAVLALAQAPFCIDPAVSAEFGLDTRMVSAPAAGDQWKPSLAFDGTNCLAVWSDDYGVSKIFATRLSTTGTILDPLGIRVCAASGEQDNPAVAWNGSHYLVAWEDSRHGATDIYASRISTDGVVVEPQGVPLSRLNDASEQTGCDVASDGETFFVVWSDSGAPSQIDGRVVGGDGVPHGDEERIISSSLYSRLDTPCVAWGGTNYFVGWSAYYETVSGAYYQDIYGARVTADGRAIDSSAIPICLNYAAKYSPDVAWGGGNFLVVWSHAMRPPISSGTDIHGALINAQGQVITNSIQICTAANSQDASCVAFGSSNFLVAWQDSRHWTLNDKVVAVYATRVSPAGVILDPGGFAVCDDPESQYSPAVTWSGDTFLTAWEESWQTDDDVDIFAARILPDGSRPDGDGYRVSHGCNSEQHASAAWGASNYLVVWESGGEGAVTDIRATRIGPAGNILDAAGIDVCMATNNQSHPAVAWDGSNFMVIWEDERNALPSNLQYQDLYGARIDSAGSVLNPLGIGICTNLGPQMDPCLAGNGQGQLLAAWRDYRIYANPPPSDIYGTRISGGTVLDPAGIAICTATNSQLDPAVAFGDGLWLVVWEDGRDGAGGDDRDQPLKQIHGSRVNPSGTVLDAAGIQIGTGPTNQINPAVAWGTDSFLCLWQDARNAEPAEHISDYDIYGARVNSSGVVLDPACIPVYTNARWQSEPALAWTGEEFLCLWEDQRDTPESLHGTRLDGEGNVLDGVATGFRLHSSSRNRKQPAMAARSNGLALVVYAAPETDIYHARRITGTLVDMTLRPAAITYSSGGQVSITVSNTFSDRVYDVIATTNLLGASVWTPFGFDSAGNGGLLTFPVSGGDPATFYRVTATPK